MVVDATIDTWWTKLGAEGPLDVMPFEATWL